MQWLVNAVNEDEIDVAFVAMASERPDALLLTADPFIRVLTPSGRRTSRNPLLDNCRDARRDHPEKSAPVFDKEAFPEALENARRLTQETAELTRQLRATHQSITSLGAFDGSPLPKRPEAD